MVRNSEFWGALFWIALGIFVTWQGRSLGLGQLTDPGSGFALFWIGVLMMGLGAIVLVNTVMTGAGAPIASLWAGTRWQKIIAVLAMLVIYGLLFERVGFIILTIALLLICFFFIDPVKPWLAVLVAFGTAFGVWGTLTEVLKIQMPAGLLAGPAEEWLRGAFRAFLGIFKFVLR